LCHVAYNFEKQVRYLVDSGGTIGQSPAAETFSVDYLKAVFGEDPDLLDKLKSVIQKGLAEEPTLNLGEVAAMIVTYHKDKEGKVQDLVVHAVGGFALAREKPAFHRNGYFFEQLDKNLWSYGNMLVGFLGRDVILFSNDEKVSQAQRELLNSLMSGEVTNLVATLEPPLYFTAVFPDPRNIMPPELRKHAQAVVMKGFLGHYKGEWECLVLTDSPRATDFTYNVLYDMKRMAEITLKTRWKGTVHQTAWGPVIDPWWAFEMVKAIERSTMVKEENLVHAKTIFERVMVNAILKAAERMGRDLAAMRGIQQDKLDPREVDAQLATRTPLHYWSEGHVWGPDWPIPPMIGSNTTSKTDSFASSPTSSPAATQQTAVKTASP